MLSSEILDGPSDNVAAELTLDTCTAHCQGLPVVLTMDGNTVYNTIIGTEINLIFRNIQLNS